MFDPIIAVYAANPYLSPIDVLQNYTSMYDGGILINHELLNHVVMNMEKVLKSFVDWDLKEYRNTLSYNSFFHWWHD